ncbi:MAG: hypothetical protein EHM19_08760, partial [Candidatus Latescibacterota bacterium]
LDEALEARRGGARMILQVHDELVFEAPASSVDEVAALAKEIMEGRMALRVPLVAEAGSGANWLEAHGIEAAGPEALPADEPEP